MEQVETDTIKLYNKDMIELYESGKSRRYSLLFTVNGGAYTLAVFLIGFDQRLAGIPVGLYSLAFTSVVMIVFSYIMCGDISAFGVKMQKLDMQVRRSQQPTLFLKVEQGVLRSFRWLFIAAWGVLILISLVAITSGYDLTDT